MKKYFSLVFLVLIFITIIYTSVQSDRVLERIYVLSNARMEDDQIVVVIDPGHGGWDPGKVGLANTLEKDINLSISKKLKSLLEMNDIKVIMTREEDIGLYSDNDSSKKISDLNNRVNLIASSKADFAISIHQNSFTQEYVKGAQVFYYSKSPEGKHMAELLQTQIVETIADGNHRKAKSNNDYYMLRKTQCPLVIVECGYLSNAMEEKLLNNEEYQERMAWAIHLGIMQYINSELLERKPLE